MQVVVDTLPPYVPLPAGCEPVLPQYPATTSSIARRLATAVERAQSNAARRAAHDLAEHLLRSHPEAVLLPWVFVPQPDSTDDQERVRRWASADFQVAMEAAAVFVLLVAMRKDGHFEADLPSRHRMIVETMRTADVERRAAMWQERWTKLLTQEAKRGALNPERGLLAGYIIEDREVMGILQRSAPQLVADLTQARDSARAPRWTGSARRFWLMGRPQKHQLPKQGGISNVSNQGTWTRPRGDPAGT